MPSFEVKFEVYCSCGEGLCMGATGSAGPRGPTVTVEPCAKCLEAARDEADEEGYERGLVDGRED